MSSSAPETDSTQNGPCKGADETSSSLTLHFLIVAAVPLVQHGKETIAARRAGQTLQPRDGESRGGGRVESGDAQEASELAGPKTNLKSGAVIFNKNTTQSKISRKFAMPSNRSLTAQMCFSSSSEPAPKHQQKPHPCSTFLQLQARDSSGMDSDAFSPKYSPRAQKCSSDSLVLSISPMTSSSHKLLVWVEKYIPDLGPELSPDASDTFVNTFLSGQKHE